jgi:prepilin-type N-terminal cleavage/methylation domain-containing protein
MKVKSKLNQYKGFTLVELLVVTAVMGVLGVLSANLISSILRSQNKTTIINEARQNGNLVIDKFERDVKQSAEVCPVDPMTSLPVCNIIASTSSTSVALTAYNGDTIVWDCQATSFKRGQGLDYAAASKPANMMDVTNSDAVNGVAVASCSFTVLPKAGSNIPQIVTLNFFLTQGSGAPGKAEFRINEQFEVTVGTRAY